MKKYLAEFIGTFALIAVGAGVICNGAPLICVALAHGLTVAVMVYAMGHISGIHINPAVTVAMFAAGKIKGPDAVGYVIAQLAGASLAAYMLMQLFHDASLTGQFGSTLLKVTPWTGVLCEAVGTFLFFIVIFGAAVDGRTAGNLAGLAIGLGLTAVIFLFGPLTGGSFNPARTFGPALVAGGQWGTFWVYIVGPILGGTLAGLVQTKIFMPNNKSNH